MGSCQSGQGGCCAHESAYMQNISKNFTQVATVHDQRCSLVPF